MSDESVFAAALGIPSPSERAAYLDRACAGNPALRREVEELLAAHAADNPLDRPPANLERTGAYEPPVTDAPGSPVPGDRIGPYRLMEQIGEGGFGLVFVAEQQQPVRRKVALKVLKPGMDTRDVVARFEAERQALALMDHPNIAKVLDAGTTESGRPYFVMELVRGVPITEFCDAQKLPPRERLALFVQVCQAVQHAHQKGVIHRDIKPTNVLVTSHDGVPVPKVIDFGVAKAVGQSLTEKTIYTRFAQMIGTPLYMSPEQAEMSGLDVDTRSDVYALGVLLYELLTGTTPFDRDRFRKAAFDEIRRIIREEEPPRPSTRLTSLGATLTAVSASRGTEPGKLAGVVRGELDWIVMKALEKDRNRRYDSASGLAKDVQRYLSGDAVEACPPSLGYRLRKFYRRNRSAVLVACGFMGVTVGAAGVATGLALQAKRAEARAVQAEGEAISDRDEAAAKRREAEDARASLRRTLYAANLNLVQAAWDAGRTDEVVRLLDEEAKAGPELHGFEWHFWQRQRRQELRSFPLKNFTSMQITFSADAERLVTLNRNASGLASQQLHVWDTADGRELVAIRPPSTLEGLCGIALSPDSTRIALARLLDFRSSPHRSEVLVMDTSTGGLVASVKDLAGFVGRLAFSPDGNRLLGAIEGEVEGSSGRPVSFCQWDVRTGKEVHKSGYKGGVRAYFTAFSPDGDRVAGLVQSGADPSANTIQVWEVATGRRVASFATVLSELDRNGLSFSPDGNSLAAAGPTSSDGRALQVWDIREGRSRFTVTSSSQGNAFGNPAFSPDGRLVACALHLSQIGVWDAAGGRELAQWQGHTGSVSALAFSREGRRLLSVDDADTLKVWDPEGPRDTLLLPLDADGSRLAAGLGRRAVSPEARRIAMCHEGGVTVWDDAGRRLWSVKRPPRAFRMIDWLVFGARGDRLALGEAYDENGARGTITVWDGEGREVFKTEEKEHGLSGLALSSDGTRVASIVYQSNLIDFVRRDARLVVWDIPTGRRLWSAELNTAEPSWGTTLAFSAGGERLAMVLGPGGERPAQVVVWDAAAGTERARWDGPAGTCQSVAFRPDGCRLAAVIGRVGVTGELVVYDLQTGARRDLGGGYHEVVYTPDGARLIGPLSTRFQFTNKCQIGLRDAETGRLLLVLKGHNGSSNPYFSEQFFAFTADGHRIVSAAFTEKGLEVKRWDATPVPESKK